MSRNGNNRPVSTRELGDKLDKLRWEMRALILAAIVAGKLIPVGDVANAALHVFK